LRATKAGNGNRESARHERICSPSAVDRGEFLLSRTAAMPPDNRVQIRRPLHIRAKVVADNAPQRDCVVVDMSATGAKLQIAAPQEAPQEFTVVFTPRGVPYRRCRVVWRSDTQMGVVFDNTKTSHTFLEEAEAPQSLL
jgi:hypothetical protein